MPDQNTATAATPAPDNVPATADLPVQPAPAPEPAAEPAAADVAATELETNEEAQLRAEVEADSFQLELNKAIEEKRLSDLGLAAYEFKWTDREVTIDSFGAEYKHKFHRPNRMDEIRMDAMNVTIRKNAGKLGSDDKISTVRDDNRALVRYYDALCDAVWGYAVDEGDNAEAWVKTSTVVEPNPDDTKKDKTLLAFIPDSDKIKAAGQVFGDRNYPVYEKGKRIRSVRSRREFIVKQLFGVNRDTEGGLTQPEQVVAYHFAEATATDLGYFDTKCRRSETLLKREGDPEERITISSQEAAVLFDRLIQYVQGGTIDDKEVGEISNGDSRLAQIPERLKTNAVFVYLNFLKS